MLKQVCEIR